MIGEDEAMRVPTDGGVKKIYYSCECGKSYDNFPALYLHFQRKHGQKISTKINSEVCQVRQNSQEKVLTYFITKRNNQSPSSSQGNNISATKKEIKEIFQAFQLTLESRHVPAKVCLFKYISNLFYNYIENALSQSDPNSKENFVNDIPFLFNGFVCENMGKQINPSQYEILCDLLLTLSIWLKQKQLTNLEVEYVGFYRPQFNQRQHQ